jgi:hypothetical protein
MPRANPFRKISVDEKLAQAVERRITALHRRDSLTTFVEWVLELYCLGFLVESDDYKREISVQAEGEYEGLVQHVKVRAVQKVGPAKGLIGEGKRKTA